MSKGILAINVIALIIAVLSAFYIYSSHTNIAVTKNAHLHKQQLLKINKATEIKEVQKSFIEFIENNKISRETHNKETKQSLFLIYGIILLLITNIILLVKLNRRFSNAT